jgi:hypothetical protein
MALGYHELLSFVQLVLPKFRVTRQRNLALAILGALKVRDGHLTISEIARAMPTKLDHWPKLKRMWRFLSNLKWSPADCFPWLFEFLLSRFRPGRYLPVIIDQSTIAGRWEVLWASIPFRGRALPIYFQVFRYEDIRADPEGSQNKLEDQFVRNVVAMLPEALRPLLLFDRGYARVPLLRLLDSLQVCYVIRVRQDVVVRHGDLHNGPLSGVSLGRGALLWWPKALYHSTESYPVNLAITLNATAEEPWYLVTNLKCGSTAVRWYERRFRCEELFKDVKDQLHLETIRVKSTERVERLLFVLVIAYYALTLIGAAAQRVGLRRKVCKDKVSLAWMALRLLFSPQFLTPHLVYNALFLWPWSLSYETG